MESQDQTQRPSAMERITAVADVKGAERRQRILSRFDRILGAPEAAGEAVKIAGENIDAFKQRTEQRLVETAMDLAERADSAWSRFTNRVTETKDKAVAKAKDIRDRAVKAGLTAGTWVENKVVAVCEVPANLAEMVAGQSEARAQFGAEKYTKQVVDSMTATANLSVEQRAILERLLMAQEAERQGLADKQEEEREKLTSRIDRARERATALIADAEGVRATIESKRIFKGALAKVTA